jgi:hypothetical protein
MVAQTKAQVTFSGGGDLDKVLEKINKGVQGFGKNTFSATKSLGDFNKEAKTSDKLFEGLAKNIKGSADSLLSLHKSSKNTFSFFTKTGESTLNLSDGITNLNDGISGLALKFTGLSKQSRFLENTLAGPASHLADIADASSNTERAFIILSKVSTPLRIALKFLSNQAEKMAEFFGNVEQAVVSLVRKGVDIGVKALGFFALSFRQVSEAVSKFGNVGKVAALQFAAVADSIDKATGGATKFSESLDPTKLERVDKAGQSLAGTFTRVAGGLEKAGTGILIADVLGKTVRKFYDVQDAALDTRDAVTDAYDTINIVNDKTGASTQLFSNKLALTQKTANTLGTVLQNNVLKTLGLLAGKFIEVNAYLQGFKVVSAGIADAAVQMSGLNNAFSQAQALGIDTYAAEVAFQFGLVGEQLLLSADAAREFGQTAIAAFARTEDAAAFVTTLSSGARLQFEGYEEGLQSVTALSSDLANQLNNTVTSGDAAYAMYNALSAGIGIASDGTQDLTAQQNFLQAALKLSSGTGANAAQTLDLLAKVTTVYNLSANDAALTAAKLNQVVEQGQITFPQLTGQLGRVAATAKSMGVSLDEALASVAGLTKVQGEDALLGLTSLMNAIAGQGAEAQNEIQELGIQFDLQSVKAKGLNASLRELFDATGGNASVLKKIIPDTLAYTTALTLVNAVSGDVATTMESMGSVSEENLEAVFAAGNQSTIKQFSNIMNGFNEVLVDFGQRVQPAMQPGLDALNGLLNFLQNLPEPLKNAIGTIVVAQTAFANFSGGMLTLVGTFGKLLFSIAAFRLVQKAFAGQLTNEIEILKQLFVVQGDYAGGLLRLVNLNENFTDSQIRTNKAVLETEQAIKGLNRQGINLKDDSVQSLKIGLQQVNEEIKRVKASPLQFQDPEGTKEQLKTLRQLRSTISKAIVETDLARKTQLKETKQEIDKTLKEVNVTAAQRVERFKELLEGLVTPQLVGGRAQEFQAEIDRLFNEVLGDASLNAQEKIGRIQLAFDELREKSPVTVRAYLKDIEAELLGGFGRIEGQSVKLLDAVNSTSSQLFQNAPEEVREAFQEAVARLNSGLTDVNKTVKQRKGALKQVFTETIAALPESLNDLKPKLNAEVAKLLDTKGPLGERINNFNRAFAHMVKGLPEEIKSQAGDIRVASTALVTAMEAPLQGRDTFDTALVKAAANLREGTKIVSQNSAIATAEFNKYKEIVKQKLGEAAATFVEETADLRNKVKNEILGASAAIAVTFDTLIDEEKIKDNLKTSLTNVQQVIEENFDKLVRGEINFDTFENKFKEAVDTVNQKAAETVSPEVRQEVEQNLNKLQDAFRETAIKANDKLDDIAGVDTRQEISQNLSKITESAKEFSSKTGKSLTDSGKKAKKSLGGFNDVLDGLSGVLGTFAPGVADALDKTSTFLFSAGEVKEGLGELASSAKNYGKSLGKVTTQTGVTVKSQGILAFTNKLLGKSMYGSSASANAFAAASAKAAGGTTLLAKTTATATTGFGFLSAGITTASTALKSFIATTAPLVGVIAVFTAGITILANELANYDENLANAVGGNAKLSFSLKEVTEEAEKSIEALKNYNDTTKEFGRNADGTTKSLAQIKLEMGEIKRQMEVGQIEAKSYVQGIRGAVINFFEFIVQTPYHILNAFEFMVFGSIEAVTRLASKIPFIGKAFNVVADSIASFRDKIQNYLNSGRNAIRKFFNDVREDNQAFIARNAIEAADEARSATDDLLAESERIKQAQAQGQISSERSKNLIAAAESANRTLSNTEFSEILKEETSLVNLNREAIKEQTASLQEQLETAKDPTVKENLKSQIAALQDQDTALEQANNRWTEYQRNQQAIGLAIEANNAAQSQDAVNQNLQNTIQNLEASGKNGAKAKQIFMEVLGVVEQVNEATGKTEFIRPETVNLASQAGRRAENAVLATADKVSTQLANLNDIDSNISQDDIVQGIFQVVTAVEKAVAEDPDFAAQGTKIIETLLEQGAAGLGAEGNLAGILTAAQIAELAERQTGVIEAEFKSRTKAQSQEVENQKLLLEANQITAVEAAKNTAVAQEEIDKERINSIQKRLNNARVLYGEGSQQEKDILFELEQAQLQSDINRLNNKRKIIDEEINLLKAQKDNELELLKQTNQTRLNEITLIEKVNALETKVQDSKLDYYKASQELENVLLQNQAKFTKDAETQAAIQLEIAQKRQDTLAVEQQFELASFEMQTEISKIALERELITLKIAEAELKVNRALANQRLLQKESLGLTAEEEEALELQVSGLDQQIALNQDLQGQVEDQKVAQDAINNRQKESILLRQEAAQVQSAADVELAQIEKVLAGYAKQKEQIRLNGEEQKGISEERVLSLEKEARMLEAQTQILEKQAEQVKKTNDLAQSYFSLAQEEATNGFRRRRLEREAALERRKNMEQIQKIERINLEIQRQQRDLALERKAIELDIARVDKEVALANAEAELASVKADPRSTAEQIRAAELGVTAQQRGLEGISQQFGLLELDRSLNAFTDRQEAIQLQQQQQFDLLSADAAVAGTTMRRSDNMQISRAAREIAQEFSGSVEGLVQDFTRQAPMIGLADISVGRSIVNPDTRSLFRDNPSSSPVNLDGNITLQVDIRGDKEIAAKIDSNTLNQKLYEGLDDLFQFAINKRRGV